MLGTRSLSALHCSALHYPSSVLAKLALLLSPAISIPKATITYLSLHFFILIFTHPAHIPSIPLTSFLPLQTATSHVLSRASPSLLLPRRLIELLARDIGGPVEFLGDLVPAVVHVLQGFLVLAVGRLRAELRDGEADETQGAADADDGACLDHCFWMGWDGIGDGMSAELVGLDWAGVKARW